MTAVEICYVIPSYQRSQLLLQKTLNMLLRYAIPCSSIYVFIVDCETEIRAYTDALSGLDVNIRKGPRSLHNMRNHIAKSFPDGTCMVCIDDDVEDLRYMIEDETVENKKSAKRYPLRPYPANHFVDWMQRTFQYMKENGCRLFGIYPVKNGYFMKSSPPVTNTLRFCVGAFWGCILDQNVQLVCEEKEDVERCLLYYAKHGERSILRFNHICPVTRYYKTSGGMQSNSRCRKEDAKISANYLVERFPHLCTLWTSKKSGVCEVKFKRVSTAADSIQQICYPRWLHSKDC